MIETLAFEAFLLILAVLIVRSKIKDSCLSFVIEKVML